MKNTASNIDLSEKGNRYPKDGRIFVIDDPDYFTLFRDNRDELTAQGIHALAYQYPEELEVLQECANHIYSALLEISQRLGLTPQELFKRNCNLETADDINISDELRQIGITGKSNDIISHLVEIYKSAARGHKGVFQGDRSNAIWYPDARIKINNPITLDHHPDLGTTLHFAFNKGGLVVNTTKDVTCKADCLKADDIQMKTGWALVMDSTMWHKTPGPNEYETYTQDDPRVCVVI